MIQEEQQQRVIERVVENGQVLRDIDYTVIKHGPNEIVVQGYNRDVPFVATNMSPVSLRKIYRRGTTQKKKKKNTNKKNKNKKKTDKVFKKKSVKKT